MPEMLSPSAKKRLPNAIRALSDKEQLAFVHLRMKRDEIYIARELDISLSEAREMICRIQDILVKNGSLDMIQDPVFFPIDQPRNEDEGDLRPFQLAGDSMDVGDQVELEWFYQTLSKSIAQMDNDGRRLLDLWFNKEMKAKGILNFYKSIGSPVSSKKSLSETREQDVFYELEKNIRKLLNLVRSNMGDEENRLTPSALRAILDETGI